METHAQKEIDREKLAMFCHQSEYIQSKVDVSNEEVRWLTWAHERINELEEAV